MTLIKFAAVAAVAACSLIEARAAESAGREDAQGEKGRPQQTPSQPALRTLYDSAFKDYRPFAGETAHKDWRKANGEVRETGGHVGLLKGTPAQGKGHGAHGVKQPTPPASGEHK